MNRAKVGLGMLLIALFVVLPLSASATEAETTAPGTTVIDVAVVGCETTVDEGGEIVSMCPSGIIDAIVEEAREACDGDVAVEIVTCFHLSGGWYKIRVNFA